MRFAVIAIATFMLAACGSGESGTVSTEDGDVEYQIDRDGEEASMKVTGPDGEEVSISTNSGDDVELLPGFSIPRGATVISNTTIKQDDGQGVLVSLKSSGSSKSLIEHFRKEAEAAGVEIALETTTKEGGVIGGQSGQGLSFSFAANDDGEGGSTGQLTLGIELLP